MEIIFASLNSNKVSEVKAIFSNLSLNIISLMDLSDFTEIEENGNSFQENAFLKANYFYQKYKIPTFADDSGLIVPALNGEPGIYSARYGGEHGNHYKNNLFLLDKMKSINSREAYFLTIICYIDRFEETHYFEGRLKGEIATSLRGENGFGYDPLFLLSEYQKTVAELGTKFKNQLSHRFKALKEFENYLKKEVK